MKVATAILTGLRTTLFVDTTNRIDMALGSEVIDHLLRLPLRYFEKRPVGELSTRVNELENIRQFLTGTALTVVLGCRLLRRLHRGHGVLQPAADRRRPRHRAPVCLAHADGGTHHPAANPHQSRAQCRNPVLPGGGDVRHSDREGTEHRVAFPLAMAGSLCPLRGGWF